MGKALYQCLATGPLVPAWNLDLVPAALKRQSFEPIRNASLQHLTWKTVFLLAITPPRRALLQGILSGYVRYGSCVVPQL